MFAPSVPEQRKVVNVNPIKNESVGFVGPQVAF